MMMRVDKWIWAVRMVKSRTLAGTLCRQGKVYINGQKAKPATHIKLDDRILVQSRSVEKEYQVTGLIPKRVSADLAAKNYIDLTPTDGPIERVSESKYSGRRSKGEGRPTKKDWRDINRVKNYYE